MTRASDLRDWVDNSASHQNRELRRGGLGEKLMKQPGTNDDIKLNHINLEFKDFILG